ncbi:MAG TPA: hypothetical protein GXX17_05425 [Clostridiales bacterium]|nr:hypothetical protein [Clostridiales bacterium]
MKNASPFLTLLTLGLVLVLAISFTVYVSSLGRKIKSLNSSMAGIGRNIGQTEIKIIDNTHSLDSETVEKIAQRATMFLHSLQDGNLGSVKDIISAEFYEKLKNSTDSNRIKIQSILQIAVAQTQNTVTAFCQVILEDQEYGTLKIEPEIEFIKTENEYLINKFEY